MKLFSDYEYATIGMIHDKNLIVALEKLRDKNEIEVIIETGTNLGLGSTALLASIFKNDDLQIHTVEVNKNIFDEAKLNLVKFKNVTCHNGCSTSLQEAISFIENDDAIINHQNYSEFFIDDIVNPIEFYSNEIKGLLDLNASKKSNNLLRFFNKKSLNENLLQNLIKKFLNKKLLIVLDSAGGTGKLEFDITKKILINESFYVLLDDTHHLKHFRSLKEIKENPKWSILDESISHGWVIAKYN